MVVAIGSIIPTMMASVVAIRILTDRGCTNEQFVSIGLLTGIAFLLFLTWTYKRKRDAEEPVTNTNTLSKDVIFNVLKNQRRREVLQYLRRAEETDSIGDLAEYVAARENEVEPCDVTSAQRKSVYTALYQCHLPMMDDAGIVAYDQNRGELELRDAARELFEYVDDPRA